MDTFIRLFPLWAILLSAIAYLNPAPFTELKGSIVPLLTIIMFSMGLTLSINDFKRALEKREGKADTRAAQAPKSPEDKIRAQIETIEKIVQGAEALTFDAAAFLKALRDLNRMVK